MLKMTSHERACYIDIDSVRCCYSPPQILLRYYLVMGESAASASYPCGDVDPSRSSTLSPTEPHEP